MQKSDIRHVATRTRWMTQINRKYSQLSEGEQDTPLLTTHWMTNFQRGFLKREDKPESVGGQIKKKWCFAHRLKKKTELPDIVLAAFLNLTTKHTLYQLYITPGAILCWQPVWIDSLPLDVFLHSSPKINLDVFESKPGFLYKTLASVTSRHL